MSNSQIDTSFNTPINSPTQLEDQLWDEIFKVISHKMPSQLIPLLNEAFQKQYPLDTPIEFLSTEYITRKRRKSKKKYPSIYTDIVIRVNHTDIYHLECQMRHSKVMIMRMLEYDFSVALQYGIGTTSSDEISLHFPKSCVLYPVKNKRIPEFLTCIITFPDGYTYRYQVPTVKVPSYSLSEVAGKHLTILLPFLLLRFRPRLKSSANPLTKEELTEYVKQIIVILHNELSQGNLTENQCRQYIELINMSADQIFSHNDDLVQEVHAMTRPLIELSDDKIERLTLQLKKKDYQLQKRDSVIKSLTAELAKYKQVFGDFEENQPS